MKVLIIIFIFSGIAYGNFDFDSEIYSHYKIKFIPKGKRVPLSYSWKKRLLDSGGYEQDIEYPYIFEISLSNIIDENGQYQDVDPYPVMAILFEDGENITFIRFNNYPKNLNNYPKSLHNLERLFELELGMSNGLGTGTPDNLIHIDMKLDKKFLVYMVNLYFTGSFYPYKKIIENRHITVNELNKIKKNLRKVNRLIIYP